MRNRVSMLRCFLLLGVAPLGIAAAPAQAAPAETAFRIDAQPLAAALRDLAMQSGVSIMADAALTQGKSAPRYVATSNVESALATLLRGTGLTYRRRGDLYVVVSGRLEALEPAAFQGTPAAAQDAPAAQTAQAEHNENDIIVTAQKIEESITSVPIAVTALSQAALNSQKIETGGELLRAVPNVNFSKSNFSGYNFSIRGIGTKAISASSDPAVAVSFNNTALIRNRLFEQELFDVQRIEVLRGPQGTLYGRNATGGVVNILPAPPVYRFEALAEIEGGNYESKRASGMINIPIGDNFAVRAAGAYTKRDGFDYNSFTRNRVNGRDLWSTRVSAKWEPVEGFRVTAYWQHFEEDDNRSRTGKQLCTTDPGPTTIGSTAVPALYQARFSQGCKSASLYTDDAYGTPNALSFPHVFATNAFADFGTSATDYSIVPALTIDPEKNIGPYTGITQSRNLREISTSYDPVFRAKNDLFQFNLDFNLPGNISFASQTAYAKDNYYSSQDYNRFVSQPIFSDSAQPLLGIIENPPTPGGIFTDPQLGPSNRMLSVDLSKSRNEQWTQEIRLQSAWSGPFNFNIGANYLKFKSQDDYYVFNNLFTFYGQWVYNRVDSYDPEKNQFTTRTVTCNPTSPNDPSADCLYIDPNPLGSINGEGHNYFRSKNVVKTESFALFGEGYFKIASNLRLTTGIRYTDDSKTATPYPSQLLLGGSTRLADVTGGRVTIGYPAQPDINLNWKRFTGRAVIDWKPRLSFTDETMIYGSFSHGYKGGGTNPPRVDFDPSIVPYLPLAQTFKPEYVNAFEIGTKNVFAHGKAGLNLTGFYYDYKGYQVSQIVDRISLNENFDAHSYGLELETWWQPSRAFRIDANVGYLHTRIADGAESVDVMNRTQGNPDWVLVRPWIQAPSSCIAPRAAVEKMLNSGFLGQALLPLSLPALCLSSGRLGDFDPTPPNGTQDFSSKYGFLYNPLLAYDPNLSPIAPVGSTAPRSGAPNGGRGFAMPLGGHELPNSPHITVNIGAQYSVYSGNWKATLRGDYYRQGPSYARVYNTAYDRLHGWDNVNVALTVENSALGMTAQFYVKNLFDKSPITDTFTNSDDTGLTTNVFTLDPRIFGLRLSKKF